MIPRLDVEAALYRLRFALADLERATIAKDRRVARYLIDTEVMEALDTIGSFEPPIIEPDIFESLLQAVATVQIELMREPRLK